MTFTKRRPVKLNTETYRLIAQIIRLMPDPAIRQTAADHFGTEFNKRSKVFDPYQWERQTGGKVAPGSAA